MNNAKKHVPVQESLERIAKSLQILVKNMDKTVTEENEKEYWLSVQNYPILILIIQNTVSFT